MVTPCGSDTPPISMAISSPIDKVDLQQFQKPKMGENNPIKEYVWRKPYKMKTLGGKSPHFPRIKNIRFNFILYEF